MNRTTYPLTTKWCSGTNSTELLISTVETHPALDRGIIRVSSGVLLAQSIKVEGQVMGSSSENILKQSFGGVYSNELLAEGGSLYSERPEPFSYISVEVGGGWWSWVMELT